MADNEAEDAESEASVNHRQLNETTSIEDVDYSDGGNPAVRLKLDVTLAIRHECERLIDDYNSSNRTETEGQIFVLLFSKCDSQLNNNRFTQHCIVLRYLTVGRAGTPHRLVATRTVPAHFLSLDLILAVISEKSICIFKRMNQMSFF